MRLFIIFLTALLIVCQYTFWFGKNGYVDYLDRSEDVAKLKQENDKLAERNQLIKAEIQDLTNGFDAVEEIARTELDMVKPNEVFFRIIKTN